MIRQGLLVLSQGWGLIDLPLRASNDCDARRARQAGGARLEAGSSSWSGLFCWPDRKPHQKNQRNQIDQTDRPTRQTSPCAFCEQEGHLAAPFHLMLRFPPKCGRFTQTTSPEVIAQQFGVAVPPLFTPRYNIAPSHPVAAIRIEPGTTIPAVQICCILRFDPNKA